MLEDAHRANSCVCPSIDPEFGWSLGGSQSWSHHNVLQNHDSSPPFAPPAFTFRRTAILLDILSSVACTLTKNQANFLAFCSWGRKSRETRIESKTFAAMVVSRLEERTTRRRARTGSRAAHDNQSMVLSRKKRFSKDFCFCQQKCFELGIKM